MPKAGRKTQLGMRQDRGPGRGRGRWCGRGAGLGAPPPCSFRPFLGYIGIYDILLNQIYLNVCDKGKINRGDLLALISLNAQVTTSGH